MQKRLLLIGLIVPVFAAAQGGTSAISGSVKDASGGAIPTARVKVVNEQSGGTLSTLSNQAGLFRTGSLVPGSYRVEVEADGFQKLVRRPVTVEVGEVAALGLVLQVGAASETVDVTEAAPAQPVWWHVHINDANTYNSGTYGIPAADPLSRTSPTCACRACSALTRISSARR